MLAAPEPLYAIHAYGAAIWGRRPIEHQQTARVIMGGSAGLACLVPIRWLFARLLKDPGSARIALRGASIMILLAGSMPLGGRASAGSSEPENADDPRIAKALMIYHGCSACHEIPGVPGAYGRVGPPLGGIGSREFIAGRLPNTQDNMVRWLMNPQAISPGTAMPNMRVRKSEARAMARYLESLK